MVNKYLIEKNFLLPFLAILSLNIFLLFMLNTQSTMGYEISIFNSFNFYQWICIAITLIISIFMLLNNDLNMKTRKIGFLLFVFVDLLILVLPLSKGYFFFGRADMLSHLAHINEILMTGRVYADNFYPVSHVFESVFIQISGINPKNAMMGTPAIFFLVYVSGTYLLSKLMTKKFDRVLFLFAFGGVLLYSYYGSMFLPNSLSFYCMPLVLYFLLISMNYEYSTVSFSILMVIFLFLTAFFHPLNSINLIIMIIVALFSIFAIKLRGKSPNVFNSDGVLNTLLLVGVTFIIWFTSYTFFQKSVKKIYNWLIYEIGTTPLSSYQKSVLSSDWTYYEMVKNIILSYGHEIIFTLLFIFVIFLIIKNRKKISSNTDYYFLRLFIPLNFVIFVLISSLTLIGYYGLTNPQRELIYALFFAMLGSGLFLYDWVNKNSRKKYLKLIFLTIILFVAALIGIYCSYSSLAMGSTNFQVTETEFIGSNFLFKNTDQKTFKYSINHEIIRYSDVVNGISESQQMRYRYLLNTPEHFYFNKTHFNRYMVLTEYSIQRYGIYMPNNPFYSKKDFDGVPNNQNLEKLYDNGNFQIFVVQ